MIDRDRQLRIYDTMNRIREFEDMAFSLFEQNKLHGSVHLYTGQEAVAATVCSHLRDSDYITSTHRGHGHCIAKGASLKNAMAELMGKDTGYCKGRGGSMHIADVQKGNLGANAIVGGGIPIAAGGALAAQIKGTDQIAVSFFGDGASNQGTFHEAINLAAVWKLPVIFVCENNKFGITVPVEESTSVKDISVRARAYGIPGYTVDGNNVYEIDEAMTKAVKRVKSKKGPVLIECKTYRWQGHWTGDPQIYRPKEEVEEWKRRCPIKQMKTRMLEDKVAALEELEKIEADANQAMIEAVEFATNSPQPDPGKVMENVFAD